MLTPFQTTVQDSLKPAQFPELARKITVRLPGGVNYPKGQVLGFRSAQTQANEVQTATITGAPTGGSFTLGFLSGVGSYVYTAPIAYNANVAAVQAAVDAVLGAGNTTVGGSAGAWTITFIGDYAGCDVAMAVLGTNALTGGASPTVAITETTKGQPGGAVVAGAYASGNSDGTQGAKGLLEYAVITDLAGRQINQFGIPGEYTFSAWIHGDFLCSDLTGLDATALSALGRLVAGTLVGDAGAIICLS